MSRWKKAKEKFLKIVIFGGVLIAFVALSDVTQIGSVLLTIPIGSLLTALVVATLDRIMMGYKWRQLVTTTGVQFDILTALRIQYQANVSGRIFPVPLAADLYRAYLSNKVQVPWAIAISSIVLEKVLALLVAMGLALIGLLVLAGDPSPGGEQWILYTVVGGGLVAGGALLVLLLFAPSHKLIKRLIGYISRWERISNRFGELYRKISNSMMHYRSKHQALVVHALLVAGEFIIQLVKLVVLAYGVGIVITPFVLSAIFSVVLVVRRLVSIFESWTIGEGTAVLTATLVGIDFELAIALFAVNFAISTIAILPGIVFYWTHTEGHFTEMDYVRDIHDF